jgi:hypothetical protein
MRDSTGHAIAGMPVRLELYENRNCAFANTQTATDSNGVFRFKGRDEHHTWRLVIGDVPGMIPYELCVQDSTGWKSVFSANMNPLKAAPHDTVACVQGSAAYEKLVCARRYGIRLPNGERQDER